MAASLSPESAALVASIVAAYRDLAADASAETDTNQLMSEAFHLIVGGCPLHDADQEWDEIDVHAAEVDPQETDPAVIAAAAAVAARIAHCHQVMADLTRMWNAAWAEVRMAQP